MRLPIIAPTLLCLAIGSAQAVEFAGIEIHGFFSQGYIKSSDNAWLADDSEDGSWDLNEAGVNLSYNVTDRLRLAGSVYASNMWESTDTFNEGSIDQTKAAKVNLDYLYAQYTFADPIGIRAGRVKQAYGFYNEVRDLDVARSTAILPQSVYDNRDRETNFLVTGVAGFGSLDLSAAGSLDWQAYWGTTNIPSDGTIARQYASPDLYLEDISNEAILGGQLIWSPPIEGVRLGLSFRQTQDTHADATIPAGTTLFGSFTLPVDAPLEVDIDATNAWLVSIEYATGDFLFQGEYQRVKSRQTFTVGGPLGPALQPSFTPNDIETEGWYVLGSYRVIPTVELGGLFSMYSSNWNDRMSEDWNQYQHDYGIFARYDVTDWWTLKGEVHYVEGAGLLDFPDREAGYFQSGVNSTEYWTYFVARTTFSF